MSNVPVLINGAAWGVLEVEVQRRETSMRILPIS